MILSMAFIINSNMQCTKKHILDCPEFLIGDECPRGKQCPLRHHKRIVKSVYKDKVRIQLEQYVSDPVCLVTFSYCVEDCTRMHMIIQHRLAE